MRRAPSDRIAVFSQAPGARVDDGAVRPRLGARAMHLAIPPKPTTTTTTTAHRLTLTLTLTASRASANFLFFSFGGVELIDVNVSSPDTNSIQF